MNTHVLKTRTPDPDIDWTLSTHRGLCRFMLAVHRWKQIGAFGVLFEIPLIRRVTSPLQKKYSKGRHKAIRYKPAPAALQRRAKKSRHPVCLCLTNDVGDSCSWTFLRETFSLMCFFSYKDNTDSLVKRFSINLLRCRSVLLKVETQDKIKKQTDIIEAKKRPRPGHIYIQNVVTDKEKIKDSA